MAINVSAIAAEGKEFFGIDGSRFEPALQQIADRGVDERTLKQVG